MVREVLPPPKPLNRVSIKQTMRVVQTSADTVKALQGWRKKKTVEAVAAFAVQANIAKVSTPLIIIEFQGSSNCMAIGMSLKDRRELCKSSLALPTV